MVRSPKFTLVFAPQVIKHLDGIESKYHGLLRQIIKEQLTRTPNDETRNRKPIESPAPFAATWELRCGPQKRFGVLYDVDFEAGTVSVLAIGVKDRNRLVIGNEEYKS